MKNSRVVLTRLGGPEVLEVIEDEVRGPAAGEVRVIATRVAYADVLMPGGMYSGVPKLPDSPGYDIVGIVEAIPDGIDPAEAVSLVLNYPAGLLSSWNSGRQWRKPRPPQLSW